MADKCKSYTAAFKVQLISRAKELGNQASANGFRHSLCENNGSIWHQTVAIITTGHERRCSTNILGCSAGGSKLKPMLIFKSEKCRVKNSQLVLLSTATKKAGWTQHQ